LAKPTDAELDGWIRSSTPRAVAYARSLLTRKDEAEDVVQECYCKLLAKATQYDLLNDGTKLLMASITNACFNLTTRRKPVVSMTSTTNGDSEHQLELRDEREEQPDAIAAGNELNAAVLEALVKLPQQQRAAVELKALGYSQAEVGEILKTTTSNAGVLIFRGRQLLSQILASYIEPREES
jgi:RNA polymerase sigma-70 factor (ECF subfamily)